MTQIITVENLRSQLQELRHLLRDRAIAAHSLARETGSIEHRGEFYNCPSPACVEVRVALGKDTDNGQH